MRDYLDDLFPCTISDIPMMIDRRHVLCIRPNDGPPYAGSPGSMLAVLCTTRGDILTDTPYSTISNTTVAIVDIDHDRLVPVRNILSVQPVNETPIWALTEIRTHPAALFHTSLAPIDVFGRMERAAHKAHALKSVAKRDTEHAKRHAATPVDPFTFPNPL